MTDTRDTLSVRAPKPTKQQTRQMIAESDWLALCSDKRFLRTMFTILDLAGIYTGNFHSDGRIHAAREGRRSLGLDILRTIESVLGPDAHMRILEAEISTLKEAPNDRSRTDYDERRDAELGGNVDLRDTGGFRYLDYGGEERPGPVG